MKESIYIYFIMLLLKLVTVIFLLNAVEKQEQEYAMFFISINVWIMSLNFILRGEEGTLSLFF